MHAISRPIATNQTGLNENLQRRVARALCHPLRKPLAEHTRIAFDLAERWLARQGSQLIIDAGCGVGLSTRGLAKRYPDHAVIGIDRSADRLSRDHGDIPDNARLVRADLIDFWRLALAAGWQPVRHYLLYPNPYPKAAQLKMRWHGHAVFPAILALGGKLEVRSNWRLYIEEFTMATEQATTLRGEVSRHDPQGDFLTPFERKYFDSGQQLWKMSIDLPHQPSLFPGEAIPHQP